MVPWGRESRQQGPGCREHQCPETNMKSARLAGNRRRCGACSQLKEVSNHEKDQGQGKCDVEV